jgi:multisubunit Na+/H+ antiporter MnhE subunit
VSLIGLVFLAANILIVTNWLVEKGIDEKANWIRQEFLTGTAIAVIIALLILLVHPKNTAGSRVFGFVRRCPVCDKRLIGSLSYCGECGSKV